MKRINNLILALAGLFAVACADTFEERYDLAVNTDRYSVTAEAGKLPVTVYCSGAWTAQLTAESAWATLDRTAGSGITTIRLNYADNPGLTRSVGVVLRGSGLEKTVTVVQKAGITAPELIFLSKDLAFANGAYKGTAAFETNLPDELLRDVVPAVTYAAEGDAWISDVVYHADDEEAGETEIPLARRGLITFATAANATGEPRTATVGFSVTDADGNVFGDSFTVTQSADEARITLADDVAPIEGGRRAVAFSTNLGALLAEMKVEVTYADPAVADFISDVELGAGELTYAITANEGVEKRYATITVSCADLAGGVVSASSNITQRVTAQPREVSSADLRALFTAEDKSYASDEDHIDYLLCRVIGDAGNPNMDQNLNTGPNSITTDENDCTNYVQSLDGRYGFRLKFAAPADNVCLRGEQVKILLDGVTLSRESDPMRYTLRGLTAGNIEKAAEASALEPKARTIATLTDDDIYTYCALSGLEFSVKEGAYTNVREYDAIGNPCNANLSFAGGTQAQKAKDGAANLLYDGDNDAIYMLVNMNCGWRRTGRSVPQGVGTVSGIVVHTPMERWGGNVGRYSIRPFDEADIDIPRAAASAYATLVEWRLDKAVISVGAYKWNDNGTYTVGSAANSATQLVQNRMHATTDNTGGGARLYSENRMLNQTVTADRSYPIAIVHGYRGLNVSNYVPGDDVCKAVVNLSYVDGWEETFSANLYITQADKDDEFGREVSFADVRALATAEGTAVDEDILIEGIVVSDFHSKNMEANPSVSYDKVDVTVNDCTAYLESPDGRYGFRLRFDTPEDNVLARGTRLSLSLSGTVLTREENPERYTISSLVGENMVESVAGEAIPVKQRRISELTDDDVYTFVSLENTEFLFKEGSYANVYENYSLSSDVNASQTGNNNRMDGWASLLMDDAGNSIYAPVNMLCLWRRSGQGVPQGTGTTHGIVVHNELPRYGNVGRYQIRVLDESGFGMEWAGESAYTEFAEWDGNPHKYSFGTYAKFNSRYAYNRLESITPSDDISSGKTVPNAELFCENHVETTAAEAWPIAGTGNYNNPEVGSLGTSLTCKAYFVKAGVKGWYRWEGNEVVGYNGLRMEFSTASLNGSHMLLGFSFAAGTISATTSKTYPAHWCVEYSVDGGQSYTLCPSAATGADYVHLRSLPWWDASLAGNRYNTCSSAGIGLTDHLFRLPAEVFGRERVMVRIRPYDKVMTVLPLVWNGDTETAEISAATTYDNQLRWGVITLRYR